MATDKHIPALWPLHADDEAGDPDSQAVAYGAAIVGRGGVPKIELAMSGANVVGIVVYDSACKGLSPRKFPVQPMVIGDRMRTLIAEALEQEVTKEARELSVDESTLTPVDYVPGVGLTYRDADANDVEKAEEKLSDAVNLVARAARELSDAAMSQDRGTWFYVSAEDMKDLREQLARWDEESRAFLKACNEAGAGG